MGYSAIVFYGYVGVIGLTLWAMLKWWFKSDVALAQVWCIYGAPSTPLSPVFLSSSAGHCQSTYPSRHGNGNVWASITGLLPCAESMPEGHQSCHCVLDVSVYGGF